MKYKVEKRRDNINHRDLYIPQPAGGQPVDIKDICMQISDKCTLTNADIVAVVTALEDSIGRHLANGNSVRLGSLGSFSPRMSATPAERPEDVNADNITNVGVRFCPSPALKQLLNAAHFERS